MYEKFTERIGLKKPKVAIQTENMDKELRIFSHAMFVTQ
jgi:hypothetical protein